MTKISTLEDIYPNTHGQSILILQVQFPSFIYISLYYSEYREHEMMLRKHAHKGFNGMNIVLAAFQPVSVFSINRQTLTFYILELDTIEHLCFSL